MKLQISMLITALKCYTNLKKKIGKSPVSFSSSSGFVSGIIRRSSYTYHARKMATFISYITSLTKFAALSNWYVRILCYLIINADPKLYFLISTRTFCRLIIALKTFIL